MDVNSSAKAFLERLCFSLGSYEVGYRSLATKKALVVTIYTMNTNKKFAPVKAMNNVDMFLGHIFSPHSGCVHTIHTNSQTIPSMS